MTNRALFKPSLGQTLQGRTPGSLATNAVNEAGGVAYLRAPKAALAQYACTGTFGNAYYTSAELQLAQLLSYCEAVNDRAFVAKVAIYAREAGFMKDVPAFLTAWLMAKEVGLPPSEPRYFERTFARVIDRGKMLATFWRIVNSGAVGRKSLGSAAKHVLQRWFDTRSDDAIYRATIGTSAPSVVDVLRVAHPKATTDARHALFAHLTDARKRGEAAIKAVTRKAGIARAAGRVEEARSLEADAARLTQRVASIRAREGALAGVAKAVEDFKQNPAEAPVPDVSFLLLSSLPLSQSQWTEIALRAPWHTLRQNLNTFARHGVLGDAAVVKQLAAKLRDPEAVRKERVFPYQLLATYLHVDPTTPREIVEALHDAMEVAVENVPAIEGQVVIGVDVSGSMKDPITGSRPGATSKIRRVDVAALVAAAVLRKNPSARVLAFERFVKQDVRVEPRDSVMTNAQRIAAALGGGTDVSAPLRLLNAERATPDLVLMISDDQSWVQPPAVSSFAQTAVPGAITSLMAEWRKLKERAPNARLLRNDIAGYRTSQATQGETHDVLDVGGFSDEVFTVMHLFASGAMGGDQWVRRIEEVLL